MSQNKEKLKERGLVMSNLQDGAYFYNKGIEAYRDKNLVKAKRYLERAVKLDGQEPAFHCQLAIVHADLGDLHRSNECLMKIIDNNLGDEMPECYFFLANNYANLGLFEHARKEALIYIDKDPDGEFLEDIEDLLELLQEEDDLFAEAETFLIRYELASHELKKQNYEKAIVYFTELLKEKPDYWMAHIRLAEATYFHGQTKKAIDILRNVLSKEDNIIARAYLMTYLYESGEKEIALKIAESLKKVWCMDFDHRYSLAVCFGKIGEHKLAYERLDHLARRGFGDIPKLKYHLAVAAYFLGKKEKCINLWEKLAQTGHHQAMFYLAALHSDETVTPSYNFDGIKVEW